MVHEGPIRIYMKPHRTLLTYIRVSRTYTEYFNLALADARFRSLGVFVVVSRRVVARLRNILPSISSTEASVSS